MKIKQLIFNLLFIILFINQSKCQDLLEFEIIKETYEYNGYCTVGHNSIIKSSTQLGFFAIYQNENNVSTSVNLISIEALDGYYYYYYQTESKVSNTAQSFNIKFIDQSMVVVLTLTKNYICESPPVSLQFEPVYIPTPIKIENTFYLKNDNLKKSLQNVIPTPTEPNLPFSLVFLKSDKNILVFNLVFNPTFTLKQTASYSCSYGANSFVLTITLPIKDLVHFQSNSGTTTYPLEFNYSTKNNWDLSRLVDLNYLNYDSNFFFAIIDNYPSKLDKNQYYRIVSGNSGSGKLLISYSYYPSNRYVLSSTSLMTSYIYDNSPIQMFNCESINSYINSSLSDTPYSQVSFDSILSTSISIITNYPFDFNFIIKFGKMNYYKPIYPYGIASKMNNQLSTQYDFSNLINMRSGMSYSLITDLDQTLSTIFFVTTDNVAPVLKEFTINYLRGGRGYYALLRIGVTDKPSGFSYLYYGGNYITFTDLVYGSELDGYYEKVITVNFDTTCYYEDIAGNRAYCQNHLNPNSNFYYKLSPSLLKVPKILDYYPLDVTFFQFENTNSYDLTNDGKLVTIYFNYLNSQKDIPIQFYLLDRVNGDKDINFNNFPNNYYWLDQELEMFKITFYLPPKTCFGTLPYLFIINGIKYTNDYFYSLFGDSSVLKIVSTDCYELPPIIKSISYYGSIQSSSPYYSKTTIGWTVTIESLVNLKYFEFKIVSDLDPLGYDIAYDFVKNDETATTKTLDLLFTFDPSNTPTQTFRLYNITLVDSRGFKSQLLYDRDIEYLYNNKIDKYPIPVSPLYKNSDYSILQIKAISPSFTPDVILPVMESLTCSVTNLDVGKSESERTLTFYFSTADDTAISTRHIPQLYLESFLNFGNVDNQKIKCITDIVSFTDNNKKANYSSFCQVPYGFGGNLGISISVFGIADTSMNFAGYSTVKLKDSLTFVPVYFISTTFSRIPSIESWEPLVDYQKSLTIYGRNFAISQNNDTKVFITYTSDSTNTEISLSITTLSNVGLVLDLPSSIESFLIYVQSNNIKSNSVIITYPNDSSSSSSPSSSSSSSDPIIPPVNCLGTPICGGINRGTCIKDIGCRCIPPYTGLDCLSETIKIPKPVINEASPNVENEFSLINTTNSDIKLNTIISIVGVRELDIDGKEINKHIFNEWDYTTVSSSSYRYNSKISKSNQNVSNIQIDMEWYEESSLISFANQNITINPSSLKYYIKIDQYPFDSKFCTLELIIKSSFKSNENDVCSSKQFSLNDETDYITLQIGKYSFEGKFIKRGIIDGKIRVIDNKLLDTFNYGQSTELTESSTTNKQLSFIAIEIPNYSNNITLDPNFSVLISSNSASSGSNNSICSPSKSKLSVQQIVGIAVGGAVFLVAISLFIFIKYSKSSRFLSLKILYYKFKRGK